MKLDSFILYAASGKEEKSLMCVSGFWQQFICLS
jgi:hypothetical protein